jgi:hypothetical protein
MLNALRMGLVQGPFRFISHGKYYRIWQSRKFVLTIINRVHALMAMRVT